ncbi:MAG: hypothetical protein ABIH23_04620, partial [bacterium]
QRPIRCTLSFGWLLSLLNLLGEKIRLFSLRASLQHGVYTLPNLGEGNPPPRFGAVLSLSKGEIQRELSICVQSPQGLLRATMAAAFHLQTDHTVKPENIVVCFQYNWKVGGIPRIRCRATQKRPG